MAPRKPPKPKVPTPPKNTTPPPLNLGDAITGDRQSNQVTKNMRTDLTKLLVDQAKAADPNADVSAVAPMVKAMDVTALGEALDRARNPDPISTDADLGPLPPKPIVVPKRGRKKAADTNTPPDTTPAPIEVEKQRKKKQQPRDPAKQTYSKPLGPLPEAPTPKKRATTANDPPPPVNEGTEPRFGQYDPVVTLGRLGLTGLFHSPTGMVAGGAAALYALNKLAEMGRTPPPGQPPLPPDIGNMPPASPPPPPGGTPPVPFPIDEEDDEQKLQQLPPDDYRRFLKK